MAEQRPFRFGVVGFGAPTREAWVEQARRAEALGYSTLSVGEHVTGDLDAVAAATAAAMVTTDIRIGSLTLANDFHNPVMLARAVASLDILSNGRFEFGFGSGFYRTDYDWTGIPFDPPGIRMTRFFEAVRLVKRAFAEETVDVVGEHHTVHGLALQPKPVQRPWPPLLIGGGGRRVLEFAAREADIIGINIRSTPKGGIDWASIGSEATAQKVAWIRKAASDRFPELELNWLAMRVMITDDPDAAARKFIEDLGGSDAVDANTVLASPQVMIGSEEAIVERLQRHREEYGVSYVSVFADAMEAFAPIVARLTGK